MHIKRKAKIKGVYDLYVVRGDGSTEEYHFHNDLLDRFFETRQYGDSLTTSLLWPSFGSDGTPTDLSQVYLGNIILQSSTSGTIRDGGGDTYIVNGSEITISYNLKTLLPVGSIVGDVREVGVGPAPSVSQAQPMNSRALVLDDNGDPTTIVLTSLDQIICDYTISITMDTSYQYTTSLIDGITSSTITIDYVMGLYGAISCYYFIGYCSPFFNISSTPRLTAYNSNSSIGLPDEDVTDAGGSLVVDAGAATLVTSSNPRTYTLTISAEQLNVDVGISIIRFGEDDDFSAKIKFDPPIQKTSSNELSIDFITELERE